MLCKFNMKRFIFIAIVLVALCLIIISAQRYNQYYYDYNELSSTEPIKVEGYEKNGNEYVQISDNPILVFDVSNNTDDYYGVDLWLDKAPYVTTVEYADSIDSFSSIYSNTVYGTEDGHLCILSGNSNYIKLSLTGTFTVKSISLLTNQSVESVNHTKLLVLGLIIAIVIAFLLSKLKVVEVITSGINNWFKHIIDVIKLKKIKVAITLVGTIAVAFFSIIIEKIYSVANNTSFNSDKSLLIFAIVEMVFVAILFWKSISKKPERIFAVVAFLVGLICIEFVPNALGTMWDDETHYKRTAQISYLMQDRISYADSQNIGHCLKTTFEKDVYGIENEIKWNDRINGDYTKYNTVVYDNSQLSLPSNVAYIPGAFGLMVARTFNLSYTDTYVAGKVANLLFYICCYYFAIKIVKRGKMLLCAIALIPTSIFMASSYSYDGWILPMVALGYALFINATQNAENGNSISRRRIVGIFIVLLLGLLPKAIYFPLVLPLLFACRYYVEKNNRRFYWIICIITTILLILSFIVPMLISSGEAQTDVRGGADVSVSGQIGFILNNPTSFLHTLFSFIKGYISLDNSKNYLTYMGHLGLGNYYVLTLVTIFVVAFLEGKLIEQKLGIKFRVVMTIACIISVILVVTSLYIAFTPVGSDTVNGCQYRYILPMMFPFLYYIFSPRIDTVRINKSLLGFATMGIMSAVTITNVCCLS